MKKLFYPAIFHLADEGGFWISFPDIPECLTEGDDWEQAYDMATDALGLAITSRLQNNENVPLPSSPDTVLIDDGFLVIVGFDMIAYKKRTNSKSIKKTLTIPEWLNEEALSVNINFSQVLQDALIKEIESKYNTLV